MATKLTGLIRALSFSLILLIVSCGEQISLTPLEPGDTIVAFGDSLTFGTGAKTGNSYPDFLQQKLAMSVVNAGVPGNTTSDGVKRIDEVISQHQPNLVILCLGGNDFLRKRSKQEVIDNLTTIINKIRDDNREVMMIAVPELGLFLSDAELYRDLADNLQVPLLEDSLSDLLSDNSFKSDAIHLNEAGYAKLAEQVYRFLVERGAKTQ